MAPIKELKSALKKEELSFHRPWKCCRCTALSAATAEATALIKNCYSTAVKGAQEYNTKVIEFANANTEAAFAFAKKLSAVKSPSDFIELSTEHSCKQFETLTEQTKELAALAQNVTLAATEPLKTGVTKAFSQLG
jgi:phasin